MKIKHFYLIVFAPILFASCSHLYQPALYHQDIAYQPKPASFDSVKAANYISGGLYLNSNTHYNDFLTSGQVNLSRGYVFNGFNLAFGAFGVLVTIRAINPIIMRLITSVISLSAQLEDGFQQMLLLLRAVQISGLLGLKWLTVMNLDRMPITGSTLIHNPVILLIPEPIYSL